MLPSHALQYATEWVTALYRCRPGCEGRRDGGGGGLGCGGDGGGGDGVGGGVGGGSSPLGPAPLPAQCTNTACFYASADEDRDGSLDREEVYTFVSSVGAGVPWLQSRATLACCAAVHEPTALVDAEALLQCMYGEQISFLFVS